MEAKKIDQLAGMQQRIDLLFAQSKVLDATRRKAVEDFCSVFSDDIERILAKAAELEKLERDTETYMAEQEGQPVVDFEMLRLSDILTKANQSTFKPVLLSLLEVGVDMVIPIEELDNGNERSTATDICLGMQQSINCAKNFLKQNDSRLAIRTHRGVNPVRGGHQVLTGVSLVLREEAKT